MKRIGSVLIALLLVFSCTACGNGQQTGENAMEPSSKQTEGNVSGSDETASSGQTENHDNTVADTENTTGKTLVVYYSATGTTKKLLVIFRLLQMGICLRSYQPKSTQTKILTGRIRTAGYAGNMIMRAKEMLNLLLLQLITGTSMIPFSLDLLVV